MNEVRSTTNLTAGLSGGAQEPMSDFYDEVIKLVSLSNPFPGYQHPAIPIIPSPPSQPGKFAHIDPRISHAF